MSGTEPFTPKVYDAIGPGAARSAERTVPRILTELYPDRTASDLITVADVGCGEGHWAAAFRRRGCVVTGIDGDHVKSHILGEDFVVADLSERIPVELGPFDIVVCLEVGEHLPETRAAGFVAELCEMADTVVFSAAIPFQTGPGHINYQWPSWWAELFAANGFGVDGWFRFYSDLWDDPEVEEWYRQNIVIARRGRGHTGPLDVVHPVIHTWGR